MKYRKGSKIQHIIRILNWARYNNKHEKIYKSAFKSDKENGAIEIAEKILLCSQVSNNNLNKSYQKINFIFSSFFNLLEAILLMKQST